MFTGIITHLATIEKIKKDDKKDLLITISLPTNKIKRGLKIGCSIAINGICLTLVKQQKSAAKTFLSFQASAETCEKTNLRNWKLGDSANIEFALKVGDELGGHIVSGHIDGVAKITSIKKSQDSHIFSFEASKELGKFIATKGSVTLDGISLTVNQVKHGKTTTQFQANIIPHTFYNTNLAKRIVGNLVNLEIDILARYVLNIRMTQ